VYGSAKLYLYIILFKFTTKGLNKGSAVLNYSINCAHLRPVCPRNWKVRSTL